MAKMRSLSFDVESPTSSEGRLFLNGPPSASLQPNNATSKPTSNSQAPSLGAVNSSVLYTACSVSMVLLNKALNNTKQVSLPMLLVLAQSVTAILLCHAFAKFTPYLSANDLRLDWETAKKWLPVNIAFIAMLMTSMLALEYNSVPMVTVFKNISNIFTATGDLLFFGERKRVE